MPDQTGDPHVLAPGHAPTPFTAEEIRAASSVGKSIRRLVDDAGGPPYHVVSRYLECGGGYEATAAALSVHRSTLKYRLQRIREISGHDLSNPDTAFNLQLATRGWQTVQGLRS